MNESFFIETKHAVDAVYRYVHQIMMSPDFFEKDVVTFALELPMGARIAEEDIEMDGLASKIDAFAQRFVERALEHAENQRGSSRFVLRARPSRRSIEFVLETMSGADAEADRQGQDDDHLGRLLGILERDQDERIAQSKALRDATKTLLEHGVRLLDGLAVAAGPLLQHYFTHAAQNPPATEPAPIPPPAESAARETGGPPS